MTTFKHYGRRCLQCSDPARVNGLCHLHHKQVTAEQQHTSTATNSAPGRLSADDVAEIKRMRAGFATIGEIAARFGVSHNTVRYHLGLVKP